MRFLPIWRKKKVIMAKKDAFFAYIRKKQYLCISFFRTLYLFTGRGGMELTVGRK